MQEKFYHGIFMNFDKWLRIKIYGKYVREKNNLYKTIISLFFNLRLTN